MNSVAGEPKTNTLYVVALEDGVVKQGHAVTSGETLAAQTVTTETYALSSAYESGKTYKVDKVSGTIGDNFSDSLYYDADGHQYYSVIADLTKVVGTMGNPVDQDYYFVYINSNGQSNRLCAQAYAYDKNSTAETVVLLSKGEIDSKKVRVEFSLEDMDMSGFQKGATYEQIKAYVLEHTGLKVSSLYISQIKRKCGLDVGQNYNLSKKEDAKVPKCPPEKEAAIRDALKYFQMI